MRQVPTYLVIGSGRMAAHFCHYLTLLKIPFNRWSRRDNTRISLHTHLLTASHILLLIKDTAISPFANEFGNLQGKTWVHFSGQLSVNHVYGAHPLMTFSESLYEDQCYYSIPFIIEKGGPSFEELLPGIANPCYQIAKELKPFYHALCVMSNNFSCILWQKFYHELEKTFQLPPTTIHPLLIQTFKNLADNPKAALTGPLVRNDQQTILNNLSSLKKDKFQGIYQAFVNMIGDKNEDQ